MKKNWIPDLVSNSTIEQIADSLIKMLLSSYKYRITMFVALTKLTRAFKIACENEEVKARLADSAKLVNNGGNVCGLDWNYGDQTARYDYTVSDDPYLTRIYELQRTLKTLENEREADLREMKEPTKLEIETLPTLNDEKFGEVAVVRPPKKTTYKSIAVEVKF
jgi:hypothetical protein